jgi:hypothetical protein
MSETSNSLAMNNILAAVRFWTYLIFDVLSIVCSLSVLYYFLSNRTLRRTLNNHMIIVLLFVGLLNELISVPWVLYRSQFGISLGHTRTFYLCSFFFDYALFSTQVILVAWATLERHILIFHQTWVSTRKKRFFVHYLPIIVILIYCLAYYSVITFGPFCRNSFVSYLAGGYIIPCIYGNEALALWELVAHQAIPNLIIIIFSIAIIVRVLRQKRKLNQPITWQKHRKMTIQLVSISVLYFVFNTPWIITLFVLQFGIPENVTRIYIFSGIYFRTYIIFLYPFVCFGSSTEVRNEFKKKFSCCRQL